MLAAGALDSGRYELGRLLGRGGLGEVYLARDHTLDRDVAIKFVRPNRVADGDTRRALLREARAAASLDHPCICAVYEAGETETGDGFIVMQYVEGRTLSSMLQQGPMPVRDALALCADVAEALATAHRHGVVHRDLKPGNIMVTPSGRPKLVDFGIAKVMLPSSDSADASTATASTAPGALVGTPAYMSPEQIQRRQVDGRSDLFSLGAVLFECLTGRRAFDAASSIEAVADILHVHPPDPSTLRPELTGAHDELCRRLLAKEPADRFQSAEEAVGAIRVLQPDTSRTGSRPLTGITSHRPTRLRAATWTLVAIALAGVSAGTWMWMRPGLPTPTKDSDAWYRKGVEATREGAYETARKDFEQAIALFGEHVLAHARIAEVETELDEPRAASEHLVRLSQIVPNESRLPTAERLRLQAVKALILRQVDASIAAYRQLTTLDDRDAGAFVDLGRAQEAAGLRAHARESYEQAIKRDPQYAAAYLRLGHVEAQASRKKEALAAFAQAERLYSTSSDVEGQAEVALNRGTALYAFNDISPARVQLERALQLATGVGLPYQQIRARLALSSVTASEGRYTESERVASDAIAQAEANGLQAIAAGGLVDLAATLMFANQKGAAEQRLRRAIQLAEGRGARYTAARATVQLAEVKRGSDETVREAITLVDSVLPFLKENHYSRLELTAELIGARAHERLDDLDQARDLATGVLRVADSLGDEDQWASAASALASILSSLGRYPEALGLRDRAAAIHLRQGDNAALPYDLGNRADLLIRLNRPAEAGLLLDQIERGIQAGRESFGGRRRRLVFLRAFAAVTSLRCADAIPRLQELQAEARADDTAASLAPALHAFCSPRLAGLPKRDETDPPLARERQYWFAAAALRRRDPETALAEAEKGLQLLGARTNDELRWRLAAAAAIGSRQRGDGERANRYGRAADEALQRLSQAYQADFSTYAQRPDLVELKKREQN